MPRKLAAGNWKMNGDMDALAQIETLAKDHTDSQIDILICPPATLLRPMQSAAAGVIKSGAQDCHRAETGAHTGDLSAKMLAAAGATYIITGHSERRTDHSETDAQIAAKSQAVHAAGTTAIICIGETLAQREAGETLDILTDQLTGSLPGTATSENTVIAYEPVWAIGTGKVPTSDQISEVHQHLRDLLTRSHTDGADFTLLYGGSVKGSNASEIFAIPHVNGALVGGASLKAVDFSPIITALESTPA